MRAFALSLFACTLATGALADDPRPFATFDKASEAVLMDPHDLAFGPDGRLYVADKFGARIAVFDPETLELIEYLAEGILPGVHDIAFGLNGEVIVAVTSYGVVAVWFDIAGIGPRPDMVLRAPATEGAVMHPNGRIYAMANSAVLAYQDTMMVAASDGHVGAHDIAVDPEGNLWVADTGRRRLVKYSPDLTILQVIDHAKFGLAGPRYMDFTEFGHIVLADQDAHRILLIDPNGPEGGTLLGVLGDGLPGIGPNKFDDPEGVAVRGNQYFFADSDNNRIVRYTVVLN